MATTATASTMGIGSDERIALARSIAGLVGKIARLSVVRRPTGLVPATDHLSMAEPGTCHMTAAGVILDVHDSCFAPEREGWMQVRELATPFGSWRICPGIHNGGGKVFTPVDDLNRLLEECGATDLPRTDTLFNPALQLMVLQRIGEVTLPDAIGVKNEFDIPGYGLQDCDARKREWKEQIAPNLPEWYSIP